MSLQFSATEASVLSGLPVRQVNRAVEKNTVLLDFRKSHGAKEQFRLPLSAVICLTLEMDGAKNFPARKRRELYRAIANDSRCPELRAGKLIIVDVASARRQVACRLRDLRKAKKMVVSDPEIMGGTPVIRGTRVPVYLVAKMVKMEPSTREILDGYPTLDKEKLRLASIYAAAVPPRGRPRRMPWKTLAPIAVRKAS